LSYLLNGFDIASSHLQFSKNEYKLFQTSYIFVRHAIYITTGTGVWVSQI